MQKKRFFGVSGFHIEALTCILIGFIFILSCVRIETASALVREDSIPTDFFPGFSFERYNLDTVFNMTEEEANRVIIPSEIIIYEIIDKEIGKHFFIPATVKTMYMIRDEKKNTVENQKHLESGEAMLFSDLMNYIGDRQFRGILEGGKNKTANVYYELITGKIIGFSNNVFFRAILNRRFVDNYKPYEGDPNRTPFKFSSITDPLKMVIKRYTEDASSRYINKDDVPYEILDTPMTIKEFIEKIYMKVFTPAMIAAKIKYDIQNMSIPAYKPEFLATKLSATKIGVGVVIDWWEVAEKVYIYSYDSETDSYTDLITNQKMDLVRNPIVMNINNWDTQFYDAFTFAGEYHDNDREKGVLLTMRDREFDFELRDYYYSRMNLWPYFHVIDALDENSTIGDLIDAYKRLPVKFSVDYSNHDFSTNPNVL